MLRPGLSVRTGVPERQLTGDRTGRNDPGRDGGESVLIVGSDLRSAQAAMQGGTG